MASAQLKKFNHLKKLPWLAIAGVATFALAAPPADPGSPEGEAAAPIEEQASTPPSPAMSGTGNPGIWASPAHEGYTPDNQGAASPVLGRISRVTIYSDRAQVARTGQLELKPGFQWLVFPKLPSTLDKSTLRISTSATIAQVLIEDSFEHISLPGELKSGLQKLRELHGQLLELIQTQKTAEQHHAFVRGLKFEAPFSKAGGGKDYRGFAAAPGAIQTAMEEIRRESDEDVARLQSLAKKRQKLDEEIAFTQAKIQNATSTSEQKWAVNVYVLVHSSGKSHTSMDLTYMIPNALWHPVYDVRAELDRGAGRAKIELVTAATVEQHTGENWKDVELTVSTLDPVPLYLPRLTRWTLSETRQEVPQAQPMAMAMTKSKTDAGAGAKKERAANKVTALAKMQDAPAPAAPAVAGLVNESQFAERDEEMVADSLAPAREKKSMAGARRNAKDSAKESKDAPAQRADRSEGTPFTLQSLEELFPAYGSLAQTLKTGQGSGDHRIFDPTARTEAPQKGTYGDSTLPAVQAQGRLLEYTSPFHVDVGNDEDPYKIPLRSQDLTADLTYFAIPKKDTRVYLRAETSNSTKDPLLSGALQIFMNGDLVAKSQLPSVSEGGHFAVDLGVDSNVETKRIVSMKSKDSGLIVTEHVTEVEVKIELANHHAFPVKMEIRDNYPLSPGNKIKAEVLEVSPEPQEKPEKARDYHGLLSWKLTVPAASKKTIRFTYKVSYPSDYILSEFN